MLDVIKRLFAYDAWANARSLDSLKGAQSVRPRDGSLIQP
jgi:hypothetical protein